MNHSFDLKLEKLKSIIKAEKTRARFEKYIFTLCIWETNPQDITYPTQVRFLQDFICSAFRYHAHIDLQKLESYLADELLWSAANTKYVIERIKIGFEMLEAYKKFY